MRNTFEICNQHFSYLLFTQEFGNSVLYKTISRGIIHYEDGYINREDFHYKQVNNCTNPGSWCKMSYEMTCKRHPYVDKVSIDKLETDDYYLLFNGRSLKCCKKTVDLEFHTSLDKMFYVIGKPIGLMKTSCLEVLLTSDLEGHYIVNSGYTIYGI